MSVARFATLLAVLLLAACNPTPGDTDWTTHGTRHTSPPERDLYITIGDVDSDTPIDRINKIRPLAHYLALKLGLHQDQVRVRIAKSILELTALMRDGQVDLYIDSSYPVMLAVELADAEVVLESPVLGERAYASYIIASSDGPVTNAADLVNRTIALQEPYSTSGFLLPAAWLLDQGYALQVTAGPVRPEPGKIGFYFSGDETNTISMVRLGFAAAGALSSLEWQAMPSDVQDEFRIIGETSPAPRKLLAVRNGLETQIRKQISDALLEIRPEDTKRSSSDAWTWEFLRTDESTAAGIATMYQKINAIRELRLH